MALFEQIKETVGFKREEKQKFFWVVYIGAEEIVLALVKTQEGEFEILKTVTSVIDEERGLAGLTQTLGNLIKSVSFDEKPREVFFGVPHLWLTETGLKKPHQEALKRLTQDLNLVLSGFVSSLKAVLEFYRRQEGVPANFIFLEVYPKKIRVAVCQKGQVARVGEKEIGESLSSTLEEILKEDFTGESLPSRIVIFGKKDFEKIRGEILSYPFEQTGLFLHLPKTERFSNNNLLEAIGFFAKESLDKKTQEVKTEKKEEQPRFGFVVDQDISQKLEGVPETPKKEEIPPPQPLPTKKVVTLPAFSLTKIFAWAKKVSLPHLRISLPKDYKVFPKPALLIAGLVILVFAAFILGFWYLPKAKITIFAEPKDLQETVEVMVIPEDFEASESAKLLKGKVISTDVSGELAAQATGKKLTGEKAVGKVTVFNKTLSAKSFPQGAEIVGPNDLSFTLDSPVSVDPATISTSSGSETKTYGRAEVSVTAKNIGSEYNLPGGIDFSFRNFSDTLYSAYSAEGFSGGSSQEVTVVSAGDQEKLEADLTEELRQKAEEKLLGETGENLKVFPEAITLKIKNQSFDHEINEEAEAVSLSLEAEAQTLGFSRDLLNELLVAEISERVPEGFELIPSQIESRERFKGKYKEALILEIDFKVNLLPKLKLEKVKQKLVGKKPQVAQDYLAGLPRVAGAQIVLWPPLPSPLLTLPHKAERISIEVKPE